MEWQISKLEKGERGKIEQLLSSSESSLLYTSLKYISFIEKLLEVECEYLIAEGDNGIEGCLPYMIKNGEHGPVANSLPFYGSNGGAVISPKLTGDDLSSIKKCLFEAADSEFEKAGCIASTIISNPLDATSSSWMQENYQCDHIDERIGQITPLPPNSANIDEALLEIFEDPRPRNIRKAIKSELVVSCEQSDEDVAFLAEEHRISMEIMGGLAKSPSFFEMLSENFEKEDYRIYIAKKDGVRIAALLLFYFNNTVEYFTPVTVNEFRNLQPSALLIFEAMKDAVSAGYKYWNWGGTWLTQDGLYNFKKKWGSIDYSYYYFTKVNNKEVLKLSRETLLKEYSNFFVLPFDQLEEQPNEE